MTAAALLTGLACGLLWLLAGLIAALILGAIISNADRDCDGEQADRKPVSERPSKILLISNHGGRDRRCHAQPVGDEGPHPQDQAGEGGMIDLPAYFRREAAIYALPGLMAANLAKQARLRSERTSAGNRTRTARRAGA